MAAMEGASTLWKVVRPHMPLIRFRKGRTGLENLLRGALAAESDQSQTPPTRPSERTPATSTVVLEEWQVPLRFQRPPLTEEEIAIINSGGAAP